MIKRFRSLGWDGPVRGKKHDFMVRGTRKVRLPNEHGATVSVGLVGRILQQAGVSPDEWDSAS